MNCTVDDVESKRVPLKAPFRNTLFSALKPLEGHVTTVELNSEMRIRGEVDQVSPYMDISLKNAICLPPISRCSNTKYQPRLTVDNVHIRSCNIRYILFPDTFNVIANLQMNMRKAKKL